MKIQGGKLFIRRDEQLPQMIIRDADVILDMERAVSEQEIVNFLASRCGRGSDIQHCNIMTIDFFGKKVANEFISRAKREAAPQGAERSGFLRRLFGMFKVSA